MHDLLIDTAKNRYLYSREKFDAFKKELGGTRFPPGFKPDYKNQMEIDYEEHSKGRKETQISKSSWKNAYQNRPRTMRTPNILDILYIQTVKPHVEESLEIVRTELEVPPPESTRNDPRKYRDEHLANIITTQDSVAKGAVRKELALLSAKVDLRKEWGSRLAVGGDFHDPDHYNATLEDIYSRFHLIQPSDDCPDIVRHWDTETVKGAPKFWSLLKASAFYAVCWEKYTMVFHVAGKELAYIKAMAMGEDWGKDGVRIVTRDMWAGMRPRRLKSAKAAEKGVIRTSTGGLAGGQDDPDFYDPDLDDEDSGVIADEELETISNMDLDSSQYVTATDAEP